MRRIVLILAMLALAGCDSGEVSLNSAIEAARDANFDMAISQYQALIRDEPENALYHNNFGWTLFRNGQFKEAIEQLQKARKLDFDEKLIHSIELNLAMISEYESSRQTICVDLSDRAGLAYLSNEADFQVTFRYSANELGYLLLAECYQSQGDATKANLSYNKVLKLFENKEFESTLKSKANAMLQND